ncbi:MAG TPA: tetratricopeptide repeat protein [Anaerolineales bacterium]|nr:tetratricopeptide repeat protein [Anaerolineales bacterium]
MSTLPSGTVTFLFTDIEGSTKLSQQYREAMPALLARHNQILHQAIESHSGYVFQVVGDSFAAAFHFAHDAVNAAVDAQRILQNESWNPAPIKVRMGIHTGAAQLQINSNDNPYSGYATIATVQRIMSAGYGGQVLLSGASRELVRDILPADTELLDMGEKHLKDLLRPERIYQLSVAGLPAAFPPLKTLDLFPNNLPVQLTSFVGRENEIAELKQELEAHRLVTLTGSGGTGKTRLSLQVAADLLEKFDHGVWFVELAPLTDPDLIPQTILSTIGISEQPSKTPLEILKEYFHEKNALIVLDNCEHLITASAQVTNALLNAAPGLKVLASSREALGVKGELSYPVPSLSLPDVKHLPAIEQLSQYEAVRLFIDRALLVAPHFVVDKDNAPFIAQICYRLDGIPLAIELAAARIKMLSVEQISERLDDRFRLLTGGARTALPRQQTLRALIDWSYDLLTENERLLLRRLSVFAGGWTLEAAEEVCVGVERDTQSVSPYDILDLLTQLVNKSLVVVMEQSQGRETRYRMLETIRQYAREKMLEAGASETVRDKHLAYFVKLVEQAEPELYRSNQVFWLNKLDDEIDNLRMAVEWAIANDVESGLRIAAIPWRFWLGRTYLQEVDKWLKQLLEQYKATNALHAQTLAIHSLCKSRQGDFSETIKLAKQSLEMARTLSDKQTEALSLAFLGVFMVAQGTVGDGTPLLEQALAIYRLLGDKVGQADTAERLAINNNDMERAIAYTKESLALARELGDLSGMVFRLCWLSRLMFWTGDFISPIVWLEEALSIARQLGNQTSEMDVIHTYGDLSYWQGNYPQAITHFENLIQLSEKIGDHYIILWAHVKMAYAVLREGKIQQAHEIFRESIHRAQKADLIIALVFAVEGLASLQVNQNQPKRAAQFFAWADAMREKIGNHRPPVEQASVERDLVVIRSKVNDEEYARLSIEGSTMTVEQAIALALEE